MPRRSTRGADRDWRPRGTDDESEDEDGEYGTDNEEEEEKEEEVASPRGRAKRVRAASASGRRPTASRPHRHTGAEAPEGTEEDAAPSHTVQGSQPQRQRRRVRIDDDDEDSEDGGTSAGVGSGSAQPTQRSTRRDYRATSHVTSGGADIIDADIIDDEEEDDEDAGDDDEDERYVHAHGEAATDEITGERLSAKHVVWRSPDGSSTIRFNLSTLRKIAVRAGAWRG